MPTTNQEVSTRDMAKNHNSVTVLRIPVKFWWMIPMVVRRTTQTSSKKLNGGSRELGLQVAKPTIKFCQK